jgi:hypothetical protein
LTCRPKSQACPRRIFRRSKRVEDLRPSVLWHYEPGTCQLLLQEATQLMIDPYPPAVGDAEMECLGDFDQIFAA